jgi:hypothetical protein
MHPVEPVHTGTPISLKLAQIGEVLNISAAQTSKSGIAQCNRALVNTVQSWAIPTSGLAAGQASTAAGATRGRA